ncbi:MAG: M23 family metallopeptidase, partial [Nanoarchaeota archaeon]
KVQFQQLTRSLINDVSVECNGNCKVTVQLLDKGTDLKGKDVEVFVRAVQDGKTLDTKSDTLSGFFRAFSPKFWKGEFTLELKKANEFIVEVKEVKDNNVIAYDIRRLVLEGNSFREKNPELTWPTNVLTVNACYGMLDSRFYDAIDIPATRGTEVFVAADGVVVALQSECKEGELKCGNGYGNFILLRHSTNLFSLYSHLSDLMNFVEPGKVVSKGQLIARTGYTGNTMEEEIPHLTFMIYTSTSAIEAGERGKNPVCYISKSILDRVKFTGENCKSLQDQLKVC